MFNVLGLEARWAAGWLGGSGVLGGCWLILIAVLCYVDGAVDAGIVGLLLMRCSYVSRCCCFAADVMRLSFKMLSVSSCVDWVAVGS